MISIVVPVYNSEKYLKRCIDSILAQTYNDIEILLVDDGSNDKSYFICQDYAMRDSRIRLFYKNHVGVSSARNQGVQESYGEWLLFADSDDWLEPVMCDVLLKSAQDNNADVVISNFYMHFHNSVKVYEEKSLDVSNGDYVLDVISSKWVSLWNRLIRSSIVKGKISFLENVSYCEDFNFLVKVACESTKIVKLSRPLYHYNRVNEGSLIHSISVRSALEECYSYDDLLNYLREKQILLPYERILCDKLLLAMRELVLNINLHHYIPQIYPRSRKYVISHRTLTPCMKLLMIVLHFHFYTLARLILDFRNKFKDGSKVFQK